MVLLNEVDKPGSDVEEYVGGLDSMLLQKMEMIRTMREQLLTFHKHLKTEETLSKLYQQQQILNGCYMPAGDEDEEMLVNYSDNA